MNDASYANDSTTVLLGAARAIVALAPALRELESDRAARAAARRAARRGYFDPEEDRLVLEWFARYLTARAGLLEILGELRPLAERRDGEIDEDTRLRAFALAYATACVLVRAGRFLVDRFARDGIVKRKLNEGAPNRRVPRKQYTAIHRSLTDPRNAWALHRSRETMNACREAIDDLASDPVMAPVVEILHETEAVLDVETSRYLRARLGYRWHAWRRRRASAVQQGIFAVLEGVGRIVADVRPPWLEHRIGREMVSRLEALLEPGDVMITRHDQALTNLFLPGFWPHAALHIGPPETRQRLAPGDGAEHAARWIAPLRVLEARKDGVLFRPLADTLSVDAVAVIRPKLEPAEIAEGIARAIVHEGKLYNFDFDFFRSDRLVCTEVVYRAFDGVGPIKIPLTTRAGRLTLSAEDLLQLAIDGRGFEPLAVFGSPGSRRALLVGSEAKEEIGRTLGEESDQATEG